jgi:hypothetical protein
MRKTGTRQEAQLPRGRAFQIPYAADTHIGVALELGIQQTAKFAKRKGALFLDIVAHTDFHPGKTDHLQEK